MAIIGYFVDTNWDYYKILLGFIPVHGQYIGSNLADILLRVLQQQNIVNRVIVITIDNALNNKTLVNSLYNSIERMELPNFTEIVRVLCLAYMI